MSLEQRLAEELIRRHPERAAVQLEKLGAGDALRTLSRTTPAETARVLQRMTPAFAAGLLAGLEDEAMGAVVEALPLDVAARLVRRLETPRADTALGRLPAARERSLRAMLQFPEGSAGSVMDPDVLALPDELTAGEALQRIREAPERARYNVYVLDGEQRLVGAVNLRELLIARPRSRLADFMVRDPLRLDARADRAQVVAHRGWREVHSLPVVDDQGGYVGAIRYRTLRALQESLTASGSRDADTRDALGELFSTGAGALLDALSIPTHGRR